MSLLRKISDRLIVRTYLAWQASVLRINFRPLAWEVKRLPMHKHNKNLVYVGIVMPGSNMSDLMKVSGFSFEGLVVAARNSLGEYLEVISCRKHGIMSEMTRSGCAAGNSFEGARQRAWCELVERDSFLSHFLCSGLKTFPVIRGNEDESDHPSVVRLQSCDPDIFVCLALKKKEDWACLGLGTGASVKEAAQKAQMECEMLLSEWNVSETDIELASPRLKKFLPHWLSAKSCDSHQKLNVIFSGGGESMLKVRHKIDLAKIDFCDSYPENVEIELSNAFVLRLVHDGMLPFSIGDAWLKDKDRIISLMQSRGLNASWAIHPFL